MIMYVRKNYKEEQASRAPSKKKPRLHAGLYGHTLQLHHEGIPKQTQSWRPHRRGELTDQRHLVTHLHMRNEFEEPTRKRREAENRRTSADLWTI